MSDYNRYKFYELTDEGLDAVIGIIEVIYKNSTHGYTCLMYNYFGSIRDEVKTLVEHYNVRLLCFHSVLPRWLSWIFRHTRFHASALEVFEPASIKDVFGRFISSGGSVALVDKAKVEFVIETFEKMRLPDVSDWHDIVLNSDRSAIMIDVIYDNPERDLSDCRILAAANVHESVLKLLTDTISRHGAPSQFENE